MSRWDVSRGRDAWMGKGCTAGKEDENALWDAEGGAGGYCRKDVRVDCGADGGCAGEG